MTLFVTLISASLVSARIDLETMFEDILAKEGLTSPPIGPGAEVTAEDCTCTNECGATVDDAFKCDWCNVPAGCGKYSLINGQWDYCKFDALKDFDAQTHKAKMDEVWKEMVAPENVGKSGPFKDAFGVVSQMISTSMRTTMDNHRDVLPIGRTKVIHSQGVHCQMELDVEKGSPFTGIFSPGSKAGIVRMGAATPLQHGRGLFPGMALKFFRSGVHSANFVALRSTGPTGGSWNYFKGDISNHVAPPPELKATGKFQQASGCPSMVGLSDVCAYDQTGYKVPKPVFPYEIVFRSTPAFQLPEKEMTDPQLLHALSNIPVGTKIFDVLAHPSPLESARKIGELKTTSKCVQSIFGDMKLAFKHQRMEADFHHHPEWIPHIKFDGCEASLSPESKWQCPFMKNKQL